MLRSLYLFLAVLTGIAAAGQDQKISGMENYAINRPGIVMVRTEYTATVYVNSMKMNNRAFNVLLDSIQSLDHVGGVLAEQKLDIVLREMNSHPYRFFQTTFEYIKQPEQITATGTGFFITGDGYVATNCHLIERDDAFIRRQFILTAFQQITDAGIAALESSWATHFTEQQRGLLYNTYASIYSRLFSMVLYGLTKNVYVVYRSDRPGKDPDTIKTPARIVVRGLPMPGKDIAILKIDTRREMPTLSIAGTHLPMVGEPLFVYGYPGPVTNNDFVSAVSAIEPTLTTGIVSALKKSAGGWPIIQMDANINHGSSGGPVCNEKGEVIGLTTFGSIENTGGLAAGLNFAIPVTILNEFLDSAGVTPQVSHSSRVFARGLTYYFEQDYRSALKKFTEVGNINNDFPGLADYITDCKGKIAKGESRDSNAVTHILLIAVLALFLAGGLAVFKRYRSVSRGNTNAKGGS